MRCQFLIGFFLFIFSFAAQAQNCPLLPLENLSYENLKIYLQNNPSIRKVDTLLSCLPDELFENTVLFHTSQSPEAEAISPDTPRVVHFPFHQEENSIPEIGNFIFSFTGDPSHEDYHKVRIIEFDSEERRFHFYLIHLQETILRFPTRLGRWQEVKIRDLHFEEDPPSCLGCHTVEGEDPKPIWTEYRNWPTAYASHGNVVGFRIREEFEQYFDFLSTQRNSSRYQRTLQNLIGNAPLNNHSYQNNIELRQLDNFPFLEMVSELNSQRVLRKMEESGNLHRFKYLLAATLLRCPLPELVENSYLSRIEQTGAFLQGLDDAEIRRWILQQEVPPGSVIYDIKAYIGSYYISHWMGIHPYEWDTFIPFTQEEILQAGPAYTGHRYLRTSQTAENIADIFFSYLVPHLLENPELREELSRFEWQTQEMQIQELSQRGEGEIFNSVCQALQEPLLQETCSWSPSLECYLYRPRAPSLGRGRL